MPYSGSLGLVSRRSVVGGTAHADRAVVDRVMESAPATSRTLQREASRDHSSTELNAVVGQVASRAADRVVNLENSGRDVDTSPYFVRASRAEDGVEQGSTVDRRDRYDANHKR